MNQSKPRYEVAIAQAWQQQLENAARTPALARVILKNGCAFFQRFAAAYQQIRQLSRQQRRTLLRQLGTTVAGAALLFTLYGASPLQAASLTVDGSCTLADAITAVNSDTATGNCAAGSGADTITLTANVTLGAALPAVTSAVTIEGNSFAIDGANAFRVLEVSTASGDLTINSATIQNGFSGNEYGGGLLVGSDAKLTLFNSSVTGNKATTSGGGIANVGGAVTLTNSTVSNNEATNYTGGGIENREGILTLTNSSLSGNRAGNGGGIFDFRGTVTLTNSSITDNHVFNGGGGILTALDSAVTLIGSTVARNTAVQAGGGISSLAGACVTLTNSTVSGNTVSSNVAENRGGGGGIFNNNSTLTLTNSTVVDNAAASQGGGVVNLADTVYGFSSIVTLERSIISGNRAPVGNEVFNDGGTANSNGHNVLGSNAFANSANFTSLTLGVTDFDASSDAQNVALATILNPTLADNGGATLTHVLVEGSPAIDRAPNGPATDQRGVARPQRAAFDAGAVELGAATCNALEVIETAPGQFTAPGFGGNLIVGTNGNNWLIGTNGADLIVGRGGEDIIWGNSGDDLICGGDGKDLLVGFGGNDTLFGEADPDWIIGSDGQDTIYGGAGRDDLFGDGETDTIYGGAEFDVIFGGSDGDTLFGEGDNDTLFGQSGADALDGGVADDFCKGGLGVDTFANCELSLPFAANSSDNTVDDVDLTTAEIAALRTSNDGDQGEFAIAQGVQTTFLPFVSR